MGNIKLGIITHYYKSTNYGGVLQAYALCDFLRKQGIDAEQICYEKCSPTGLRHRLGQQYRAISESIKKFQHQTEYKNISVRIKAFSHFREAVIPHSEEVYTHHTLSKVASEYDVFITGSDQVWHPNAVCDAYLLNFYKKGIKKISYAASVASADIPEEMRAYYKNSLADYKAVSVREESSVKMIQELSPVSVHWVVDPVFLLTADEWLQIATPIKTETKYVFCYFLGEGVKMRTLAQKYADAHGCQVVSLPYLEGTYRECDDGFGDERLFDVSPEKFITLIKNASCVFTDSFHAMAFSLILNKQYFVFERKATAQMKSRIESLSNIFGTQNRFCQTEEMLSVDYLTETTPIDYQNEFTEFEKLRNSSVAFLMDNIRN